MVNDTIVPDGLAAKFATEKDKNTPYVRWVTAEGLDIIPAHYVPYLRHVELKPWARRGGCGSTRAWNGAGARVSLEWKKGAMFAEAMAKHGLMPRMDEVYRKELATLAPEAAE